jgi:hypothetical protein
MSRSSQAQATPSAAKVRKEAQALSPATQDFPVLSDAFVTGPGDEEVVHEINTSSFLPMKLPKTPREPSETSNQTSYSPIVMNISDTPVRAQSGDWDGLDPVYPVLTMAPHTSGNASALLVCMTPRMPEYGVDTSPRVQQDSARSVTSGLDGQDFSESQLTSRSTLSTSGVLGTRVKDVLEVYTRRSTATNPSPSTREMKMQDNPQLTSRSRGLNASPDRRNRDFLDPPLTSRSTLSSGTRGTDLEPPYTARSMLSHRSAHHVPMTPRVQTQALDRPPRVQNQASDFSHPSDINNPSQKTSAYSSATSATALGPLASSRSMMSESSKQSSYSLPPRVPSQAHTSEAQQGASLYPLTFARQPSMDSEASLMLQILHESIQPPPQTFDQEASASSPHAANLPTPRFSTPRIASPRMREGQSRVSGGLYASVMSGAADSSFSTPLSTPRLPLSLSTKLQNIEQQGSLSLRNSPRIFTPRVQPPSPQGGQGQSQTSPPRR